MSKTGRKWPFQLRRPPRKKRNTKNYGATEGAGKAMLLAVKEEKIYSRQCKGKSKYSEKAAAAAVKHHLEKKSKCKVCANGKGIHFYMCEFCGFYHVGHVWISIVVL